MMVPALFRACHYATLPDDGPSPTQTPRSPKVFWV